MRNSILRLAATLAVLAVFLAAAQKARGQIQGLTIDQLSFAQGANSLSNSNWGQADLTFASPSSTEFFNLVVNGSWQVQNIPVMNLSGTSGSQALSFDFSLANSPGTIVSSASILAQLSNSPLPSAPTGTPTLTNVNPLSVTIGGLAGPIGPIPLAAALIGGVPIAANGASNVGVPNQDVGVDECAPGAFSNSLMYLNNKFKLGIPANLTSVNGLKVPLGWVAPATDGSGNPIPGTGGVTATAWQGKANALSAFVTTQFFGPNNGNGTTTGVNDINSAINEMKKGEDVEVWGAHHAAVAASITQLDNGKYEINVEHDIQQGKAGGTVTQPIIYDPTTGLLTGGAPGFFDGAGLRGFVTESPVPEPNGLVLCSIAVATLLGINRLRHRAVGGVVT
jgi:hypothetical protein